MDFFGIRWVGANRENGQKLLSLAFVAITVIIGRLLRWLVGIIATFRSCFDPEQVLDTPGHLEVI